MARHNETGKFGEEVALAHLLSKGHVLLCKNFRFKRAEVDLVTQCGRFIVFTEVKTRTNLNYGQPEEFVSKAKRKLMHQAAESYLFDNSKTETPVRFDIVSVTVTSAGHEIYHIEDAFFDEPDDDTYN
ncbi:MAG: YraN family protein [Chitinophagales bacterium]